MNLGQGKVGIGTGRRLERETVGNIAYERRIIKKEKKNLLYCSVGIILIYWWSKEKMNGQVLPHGLGINGDTSYN